MMDSTHRYMTDGTLLRLLLGRDPTLSAFSMVVLDEIHERSLTTDLLLSLLKDLIQTTRRDLKIIIMSATIDSTKFLKHFAGARLLNISGRSFPVQLCVFSPFSRLVLKVNSITFRHYAPTPQTSHVLSCVETVRFIHRWFPPSSTAPSDVLVFLPGEDDISLFIAHLFPNTYPGHGLIHIFPLHSSLPLRSQEKALLPLPLSPQTLGRKCIVATNYAETSLTLNGASFHCFFLS